MWSLWDVHCDLLSCLPAPQVLSFIFIFYVLADTMVEPVPESIHFPSEEEKIMQLWQEKDCFQECLKQSKNRPK